MKLSSFERWQVSDEHKDGGPAFPIEQTLRSHNGMSLRDYFAAAALTGMAMTASSSRARDVAITAYEFADAMLAERRRQGGGK